MREVRNRTLLLPSNFYTLLSATFTDKHAWVKRTRLDTQGCSTAMCSLSGDPSKGTRNVPSGMSILTLSSVLVFLCRTRPTIVLLTCHLLVGPAEVVVVDLVGGSPHRPYLLGTELAPNMLRGRELLLGTVILSAYLTPVALARASPLLRPESSALPGTRTSRFEIRVTLYGLASNMVVAGVA